MELEYKGWWRKPTRIEAAENTTGEDVRTRDETGEGVARPGDFVVRKPNGMTYSVPRADFERLYDESPAP